MACEGGILREKPFREGVGLGLPPRSRGRPDLQPRSHSPRLGLDVGHGQTLRRRRNYRGGTNSNAQSLAWQRAIDALDVEAYRDERIIVKGCAAAGGQATSSRLQRVAPVVAA